MIGRLAGRVAYTLTRGRRSIVLAVGCMLFYRQYQASRAISHLHLNKKQYIDNVLDPTTNLESEYFLIICDRGLTKQQLDKFVAMAKEAALRMGLQSAIFSVEARDIDELETVAERAKKSNSKTNQQQKKQAQRNPPSADLYFKSKLFEKLIQLDSFEPDTVEAQVSTIRNLIREDADDASIERAVKLVPQKFDSPVLVRHVSSPQKYKQFKERVHQLLSHGVLPVGTQIFVVKRPVKLPGGSTITADDTVIYRNSLHMWLERQFGSAKTVPCSLQQFTASNKQVQKNDALSLFIFPEIFMIRASNDQQQLTRLFRVLAQDRNKPTLSLRISSKEQDYGKLRLLYELYREFKHKLNFVVITCSHVEQLFGHIYEGNEEFVLFDFFKSIDTQNPSQMGYIRPYQKCYLGSYRQELPYADNLALFTKDIRDVLSGKRPMNEYNILLAERQQEINIKKLQQLMTGDTPFILRHCYRQCRHRPELLSSSPDLYWLDTSIHNVDDLGDVLVHPHLKLIEPI